MNSELVFSVGDIFDTISEDGALAKHHAQKYFIAPYQRGYKWGSDENNGPVSILLKDLFDAFEAESGEYYLQYITTQMNSHGDIKVLEVIDGQQRLTTLTLLFTVLSFLTADDSLNFVKNKLIYQVRGKVTEFFNLFIFDNVEALFNCSWEDFIENCPDKNEQDIYYLFNAVQRIVDVLQNMDKVKNGSVVRFGFFVKEKVKIILNNVSGNISCEKIFSNLNTNKVELTDVELIKGLFLTKAAREKTSNSLPTYKEIVEIRALLGRQWDEIVVWANQTDVKVLFFKKESDPVYELLLLMGHKYGFDPAVSNYKYALFNHFQSLIKTGKQTARYLFNDLKKTQSILNNWFTHRFIYNALGFLFFTKGSTVTTKSLISLLEEPLKDVEKELKKRAFNSIPDNINTLDYEEHDNEIHALLLSLSVFFANEKFDFTSFSNEYWSLEHIFPQNPDELPDILQKEDIRLVVSLLPAPIAQKEKFIEKYGKFNLNVYNSIRKKLDHDSCTLDKEEKTLLYRFIQTDKLNRMGNMALLTRGDNSSNSNSMFSKKRHNIVNRISKGSFVPKHTYDVFSKLISDKMSKDTAVWTEQDITIHQTWIVTRIANLKKTILN